MGRCISYAVTLPVLASVYTVYWGMDRLGENHLLKQVSEWRPEETVGWICGALKRLCSSAWMVLIYAHQIDLRPSG